MQIENLLYLFYPGRLSSVSVVKEEKSYSKEDVNDGGDEWEVQQQAGEVFDARTSFGDQVEEEEAQLEKEGQEHDEQVAKGKELMSTFHEAEVSQVI